MTKRRLIKLLTKARQLLKEKGWTQSAFARADGMPVAVTAPYATCYCAEGAIIAANGGQECTEAELAVAPKGRLLVGWNDQPGRTRAQVIARFTRVINRLKRAK